MSGDYHRLLARARAALPAFDVRDVGLCAGLSLLAAAFSYWLSGQIPVALYSVGYDVWFETDLPRIHDTMTSRWGLTRTHLHPLFPLVTFPPTTLLDRLGFTSIEAVRLFQMALCAVWAGLLYALLRSIGCARIDATLFSLAAMSTATAVFFFAVPETFLLGSVSILLALVWAANDERGKSSPIAEALISAATLAGSVTNWMFGLLSAALRRSWRQAIQISLNALVICVLVWAVQKRVFPLAEFFLGETYAFEARNYFMPSEAGGPLRVLVGFFSHPIVMPEIQIIHRFGGAADLPLLLTQRSGWLSAGLWGNTASALWLLLLAAGAVAAWRMSEKPRLRLLLVGGALGQLALHLAFGNEIFLYSLHWLPVLICIAALATLDRLRIWVRIIVIALIPVAATHNILQFNAATAFFEARASSVLSAAAPPSGPAPTDIHDCKARDFDLAAFDAAGGLWPAVGSFWIGAMPLALASSSEPPTARRGFNTERKVTIHGTGPGYNVRWECQEPRSWRATLSVQDSGVYLGIRNGDWLSRVSSIERQADGLLINGRWRVRVQAAAPWWIGTDAQIETLDAADLGPSIEDAEGRAAARLGPLAPGAYSIEVVDEARGQSIDTVLGAILYRPRLTGSEAPSE